MTVSDAKNCLLLIFFANSHLVISTGQIELGKLFIPIWPIKKLANPRQRVPIYDSQIAKTFVIDTYTKTAIKLSNQKD